MCPDVQLTSLVPTLQDRVAVVLQGNIFMSADKVWRGIEESLPLSNEESKQRVSARATKLRMAWSALTHGQPSRITITEIIGCSKEARRCAMIYAAILRPQCLIPESESVVVRELSGRQDDRCCHSQESKWPVHASQGSSFKYGFRFTLGWNTSLSFLLSLAPEAAPLRRSSRARELGNNI